MLSSVLCCLLVIFPTWSLCVMCFLPNQSRLYTVCYCLSPSADFSVPPLAFLFITCANIISPSPLPSRFVSAARAFRLTGSDFLKQNLANLRSRSRTSLKLPLMH
ncbi:hypothetical protein B0H13DRAFT_254374 [Mycena leptocephala]|nr:hypothetical protein B0H13DRAFT_254374 [Mycena leptocephala]